MTTQKENSKAATAAFRAYMKADKAVLAAFKAGATEEEIEVLNVIRRAASEAFAAADAACGTSHGSSDDVDGCNLTF